MAFRIVFACAALMTLLAVSSCFVVHRHVTVDPHGTTVTKHVWWYYPHLDIYYSSTRSEWTYWSGTGWVTVTRRPAWIAVPSHSHRVRVFPERRYPHHHWHQHSTHRTKRSFRNKPRAWRR